MKGIEYAPKNYNYSSPEFYPPPYGANFSFESGNVYPSSSVKEFDNVLPTPGGRTGHTVSNHNKL